MMGNTYYNVLNIPHSATQRDIKVAYRKLVQAHHPDVNTNEDDEQIKRINIAYETLSNPAKKEKYDQSLYFSSTQLSYTNSRYKRTYKPPPPYSYQSFQRSSSTTNYEFSTKTHIIGWTATIAIFLTILGGIWAMNYYSSEYYYNEGLASEANNNLQGALGFYQLAIRDWGGKSVEASIKSAELSNYFGAFHKLVNFCKTGLSYEPDSTQAAKLYYLEGTGHYHTERYKKAEVAFLNSLKFNFPQDSIYKQLGWLYVNHLNQYEKAEKMYSYLLAGNSINLADYYNRGISYQYLGKHQKAIDDFLIIQKNDPYNGKILFQLGRSYLALGQTDKACEYLRFAQQQSININPDDFARACN